MNKKYCILVFFIFWTNFFAIAQKFDFKGQADSWLLTNNFNDFTGRLGIRYIPDLNFGKKFKNNIKLDADISVKTFGTSDYLNKSFEFNSDFKPYRLWVRFSTKQFELRGGLQKINFGPATMLRPLMWFDRIDPRDPLQITNGVYGLLARYYFLNNANIWLWGLYGNDKTKGWETVPSNKSRPELGGRFQFPALKGEIGTSFHNREVDFRNDTSAIIRQFGLVNENKIGIDGRWDFLTGLWFEGVIIHQDIKKQYFPWTKQLNLGIDYTFGIGHGLYMVHEFFITDVSKEPFSSGQNVSFSALSARYPIGLTDQIMVMVYHDWVNNDWYRFINWGRQYDKISLHLIFFWNPDKFQIYQNMQENMLFTGAGLQFMFVYNH
jgi:hypothetical protein